MEESQMPKFLKLVKNPHFVDIILMLALSIVLIALIDAYTEYQLRLDKIDLLENQLARQEVSAINTYNKLQSTLEKAEEFQELTEVRAKASLSGIVCSDINYYNNKAQRALKKYNRYYKNAQKYFDEYVLQYKEAKVLEKQINKLQDELWFDKIIFSKTTLNSYTIEGEELASLAKKDANVIKLAKSAQDFADEVYLEYVYYMERIIAGECGSDYCPDEDQIYCMAVIENRILHPEFPDTVYEVIFQPGQYQPTWDGNWNKSIDKRTRKNVHDYLRGKIRVDMPRNIIYQAMFKQGDFVWKYVPNDVDGGHYYCGVYE